MFPSYYLVLFLVLLKPCNLVNSRPDLKYKSFAQPQPEEHRVPFNLNLRKLSAPRQNSTTNSIPSMSVGLRPRLRAVGKWMLSPLDSPLWKRYLGRRLSRRARSFSQQVPPNAIVGPPVVNSVTMLQPSPNGETVSGSGPGTGTGLGSTTTDTPQSSTVNGTEDELEFRSQLIREGLPTAPCYTPLVDISSGVAELTYEFTETPPCPVAGPEPDEPIPYANYKGTLTFGAECKLHPVVNDEQLKGYSPAGGYQTTTGVYDKSQLGSPDNTLNRKTGEVESWTCNKELGLECVPTVPDYFNEEGVMVGGTGVCKCMSVFGRDPDKRLVIDNQCYIPAGMGRYSECVTEDGGLPLPSGDPVYEPITWNKIRLNCTPNSKCVEHHYWTEKRCKCIKYSILDPQTGTCSGQTSLCFSVSIILLAIGVTVTVGLLGWV